MRFACVNERVPTPFRMADEFVAACAIRVYRRNANLHRRSLRSEFLDFYVELVGVFAGPINHERVVTFTQSAEIEFSVLIGSHRCNRRALPKVARPAIIMSRRLTFSLLARRLSQRG